ncbi:GNAT family N-acetyltransferase [Alteraurantiacibacter aestuarii]|uniref:GNAT family N-acetyltransferase n=1 Tax=Alteraurantiacibacter aestuarii TaxID=650004 RepID=A0A844ZK36_9SPHN|nr:GNAT family N-acetyltransferase [Alteraurantiacibacter aestuarii]MXO87924.1 GNAT family N-acetyltransferase [Alteraurantiacibacter aestuarii]
MFMRTQRLFLRPPFPEDWREVYRGINDAGLVRMLARAPWPYREDDARAYCAAQRDPMDVRLAIVLPGVDGAPLIGQIGMDCSEDVPEIGYWIARGYRKRGYATEALGGILQIARMLGVRRVQAGHYLDNPASGAVLRKAGFRETGEIHPTHALGRGGQMVLARRYALNLDERVEPGGAGDGEADVDAQMRSEANRKPA